MGTDTLIAEYGPGQFEVNVHHTKDVLHAADTVILFRRLVQNTVAKHDLGATFMAKPYADAPGNGMHAHASITDKTGHNVFDSGGDDVAPTLLSAVAGVLSSLHEFQAIFAPHLNSYRRFQTNSFAPTAPNWGLDNRNAAIRLPEIRGHGTRLEHRICGADVNPYLALAAILGGIHEGMRKRMKPPAGLEDPAYVPAAHLYHDWTDAVELFSVSTLAAGIFGESSQQIYAAVRQDEIGLLASEISPLEGRYDLGRV